jgi:hypothetical protein
MSSNSVTAPPWPGEKAFGRKSLGRNESTKIGGDRPRRINAAGTSRNAAARKKSTVAKTTAADARPRTFAAIVGNSFPAV